MHWPPTTVAEATAAVRAGLAQAECLRELARMESAHTSAQARMLAAFSGQRGYSDDGQTQLHLTLEELLHYAADVLSGPAGLAAFLRTGLLAEDFPRRRACPWTSAPPPAPSRPTCAAPSSPATGTALIPAAASARQLARGTTSGPVPGGPPA